LLSHSSWDIDLETGHMAHPSGLYSYFDKKPTGSGGIRCAGPFSAFKQHLSRSEVYRHAATAALAVEDLYSAENHYTLWGALARAGARPSKQGQMTIMESSFGFIPNPCLRSSTLLTLQSRTPLETTLLKEWQIDEAENRIGHRIGLSFQFRAKSRRSLECFVAPCGQNADLSLMTPVTRPLLIQSLSSTALCVMNLLQPDLQPSSRKRKLKIHLREF
jgi:hypothetical protein